jgi:hypothetical protein
LPIDDRMPSVMKPRKMPLPSPPPLVTNEVAVVVWGTVIWCGALVAALLARGWLREHDALWWTWVAVAGIAVGLTWGPYAIWKRRSFLTEHRLTDSDAGRDDRQ